MWPYSPFLSPEMPAAHWWTLRSQSSRAVTISSTRSVSLPLPLSTMSRNDWQTALSHMAPTPLHLREFIQWSPLDQMELKIPQKHCVEGTIIGKIHICPFQFVHILYHPSTLVSWHTTPVYSLLRRSAGNGSIKICATVNSRFIYCSAGWRDEEEAEGWNETSNMSDIVKPRIYLLFCVIWCEYHFSLEIPPLLNSNPLFSALRHFVHQFTNPFSQAWSCHPIFSVCWSLCLLYEYTMSCPLKLTRILISTW